jgi:8-oxo-dGTP pyrophosphatase MutT (NUDIX family)
VSQHREIAGAIIIDTLGRFLRDDITGIIHPGKVGLFGGHREGDEAYLECIVREIYEEVSDFVPAERFEYLASLDGTDTDVDGENVRGQFFIARDAGSPRLRLAAKQVSHGDIQPVRVDRGDDRCGYFVQRSGVLGLRLSSRVHVLIHTIRNGFLAPAL